MRAIREGGCDFRATWEALRIVYREQYGQGVFVDAEAGVRRAIALARAGGDRYLVALSHGMLAVVLQAQDQIDAARTEIRAGLAEAGTTAFDLVLVDQEMPGLDGAGLIAGLRAAATPGPMVLYMSGRAPTEALGGLLLAGADDFIHKPFTPPELLSRVRALLKRRALAPGCWMSSMPRACARRCRRSSRAG